jgi:hypothetical protein
VASGLSQSKRDVENLIRPTYVIYKHLSSDSAHPSITALKRHFVESAGTGRFFLEPRLEDGEAMDTAYLAAAAMLWGCIATNDALGQIARGEQLEALVAEFNETVAREPTQRSRCSRTVPSVGSPSDGDGRGPNKRDPAERRRAHFGVKCSAAARATARERAATIAEMIAHKALRCAEAAEANAACADVS